MRKAGRLPGRGGMAAVALRRRINVCCRFRQRTLAANRGVASAVAGRTLAVGSGVVHRRRLERHKIGVAAIALGRGRNVPRRFRLSIDCGIASTVTGRALPRRSGVIHHARGKRDKGAVTAIAGARGRDVIRRLRQSGAATLVTIGTGMVADNYRWGKFRMVYYCRRPRYR